MEHTQIRSLLGQHISNLIAQPGNLPLTLRPFQIETLESAARWLSDPQGTRRAYVSHATGLGKTVSFACMVSAASGMRSLVIVPTKTLLEQTARVITKFTGGMLGHISSLTNIQDHDGETVAVRGLDHSAVVLTTDASFNRLAAKIKQEFDPHLIIRDECHWGYIGPALAALEQFPEAVIIGFSATPDYLTNTPKGGYVPVKLENGQTLYGPLDRFADTHYQTCLDRRSVRWGIENGWLCPLAWGMIEFDVSLRSVPVVDGPNGPDYDEAKLQELMGKHWSIMCETVRRLYDNPDYDLGKRQAYAICPSVEAAEELAQAIGSLGLSAACVTGTTPDAERNILLRAFNDKDIRFLSSVMVLREGWDAPDAEVCMMLRPTKSRVLYEQGIGRSLRRPENNGHKVALVLDAHFQGATFSPLSAPALYGKPGEEIPIGGMLIREYGGAWGGEGIESPYLPKGATPRLVVIETYDQQQEIYQAGPDGTFDADGDTWGTRYALSKKLKVSIDTIERKVAAGSIRSKQGSCKSRRLATFYSLRDLAHACHKVASVLPQADHTGTFISEGKKWATIPVIADALDLKEETVRARVKKAENLSKMDGKDVSGQVADFHLLEEVNEACSDLLKEVPKAGKDGLFLLDGNVWATAKKCRCILGLKHDQPVLHRIARSGLRFREGRIAKGSVEKIYPLAKVKEVCAELLPDGLPIANAQGILQAEGEDWGTAEAIRDVLGGVHRQLADYVVLRPGVRNRKGKGCRGRPGTYYSINDAKRVFGEDPTIQGRGKTRRT